jgi:ribosome-associated protein
LVKRKKTEYSALQGRDFSKETLVTTTRSQGPGGQHVNKVNTRVEIRFHVDSSFLLTSEEKDRIRLKLKNKITENGYLIVSSQAERSQIRNRKIALDGFYRMLNRALILPKARKTTKPTAVSVLKRVTIKKHQAVKKTTRKKPVWEE